MSDMRCTGKRTKNPENDDKRLTCWRRHYFLTCAGTAVPIPSANAKGDMRMVISPRRGAGG